MRYYRRINYKLPQSARYIKTERNVKNPLPGFTFVSISYYEIGGEIIGLVF